MARRGFTLIEMMSVVALVLVLTGAGYLIYIGVRDSVDRAEATNTVRSVAHIQQRLYQREGTFTDSVTELSALEPAFEFTGPGGTSAGPGEVAVTVRDGAGDDGSVVIVVRKGSECVTAIVTPPKIDEVDITSQSVGAGSCRAPSAGGG